MKERLSGYFETRNEINYLLFRLKVDCRVLQELIKDASNLLKECNRNGSITSGIMSTGMLTGNVVHIQQRINRETNKARRLFIDFIEKATARNDDS